VARGDVDGAQLSVGGNWASGNVVGVQSAVGVNVAAGTVEGAQLSVGANISPERLEGAQLGVGFNLAGHDLEGVQGAAGLNLVKGRMLGVQLSAGVSWAAQARGLQLSLINVGGDVSGAQVGLINVAGSVRGLQLGLLNFSDDIDGVPLGLLSFSRRGQYHLELFASDVNDANLAVKLGGRYVHSLLTGGVGQHAGARYWTLGLGLGAHLPLGTRFFVDTDALVSNVHGFDEGWNSARLLGQLRVLGGWQVTRHFALIGGPSLNVLTALDGSELGRVSALAGSGDVTRRAVVWPGVQLGMRL
jgi:hypothetical protein